MLTTKDVNNRIIELNNLFNKRQFLYINNHLEEGQEFEEDNDIPDKLEEHEVKVNLSELINDSFFPLFNGGIKAPYRIFKGGRSSFKSSAISIKLVYDFLQDDEANVICFRKVAKYLSTSVYEQIKWAIIMLNVQDEFVFLKSPLRIIHKSTNTAFYFYGVDDPVKIKSAKIAEGYVKDLWFEETAEFESEEELDTVNDTFVREELPGDKQVNVYYSYNPPRNPYAWINEWLEKIKHDDSYHVHHSTYLDDVKGFLSKQFINRIERTKKNDPDYHDWMYLGKVIGLGDTVYNTDLFNIVDEIPSDDRLLFADVAIDTGYSTSATTFLFLGFTLRGRIVLLDTYYYSPLNKVDKKAPSDFSIDLWEFVERNCKEWGLSVDTWTIDSNDAGLRNQFHKDYGIWLNPVAKDTKVNMIEFAREVMVNGIVYILDTENNEIFVTEHKKYSWDPKTLKSKKPKVIEVDDHTCDAFQYYTVSNKGKLNLQY